MEVQEVNQTQVSHMVQVWAEGPEVPEAARPERAEALSPGRAACVHNNSGLRASALSGRVGQNLRNFS